jgi:peptidoglycan/LPS O-acetylase OafA/YrhL
MGCMAYMDRYLQSKGLTGEARPPRRWLTEGIGIGVLGGASVATWFLILDVITRRPLFTPAALGSTLFYGAQSAGEVHRDFPTIAAYTLLHFAVFIGLGMLFVWTVEKVRSRPQQWLIALLGFILLDGLFAGTVAMFGVWVLESIGMWAVVIGNVIAIAVMVGATWATHPELRQLVHKPVQTAV